MWQAIIDENNRVDTVNFWEHEVGLPCDESTEIGAVWDGSAFQPNPDRLRDEFKAQRQAAVDAIKVTVNTGKVFDGDELSQTRMARAIVGMQAAGAPTIRWVLADNTPTEVTLAEITEALVLAGEEQARLWVMP